jgi:sodium transport system permease protein
MSALWVVLRKETADHFRDKRSLLSGLLMPILGPLVFAATFGLLARSLRSDKPLEVPVVNAAAAPSLVRFLERQGARVTAAPADYEEQVRDGKLDVVLVVGDGYGKEFTAGRAAPLQLVIDASRTRAAVNIRKAQQLVQAYASQLGALRLLARGVSPRLAAPIDLQEHDLATPEKTAAQVLGMVPLFLLVAAFVGGMHLAIDSTAGERERGSLEPLLINPVPAREVVLGKWLATVLVTWVAVGCTLFGFLAVLARMPLADLGLRARLGPAEVAGILIAVLPVTLLSAGLQMLVATFARTFKEGQTYASLLAMVPMIPGVLLMFAQNKPALWMMSVPVLGQVVLMNEMLRGDFAAPGWYALAALAAIAAAAVCVAITVRLLSSERVIFGR